MYNIFFGQLKKNGKFCVTLFVSANENSVTKLNPWRWEMKKENKKGDY